MQQALKVSDVFPAEFQGFSVEFGVGPYPLDSPRSHRRAMYAVCKPRNAHARAVCEFKNRDKVIGMVPLTPEGAAEIEADLSGPLAEKAAKDALAAVAKLIR